jgi:serine/threonine-protein kinase
VVASTSPDLVGRTIGSYRLVERIGSGGMGDVYKAVHGEIGAKVAIKILNATSAADETSTARFLREAQAVNRIDHEDVVQIVDAGRLLPEGRPYLVMELLDGESLGDVLKRNPRPPIGTACRIAGDVLEIAAAAHAEEIVHRDLKPHNVFLTRGGRTVILDFGVAKLLSSAAAVRLTATGAIVGTPRYMAPEQIRDSPVDARADIYSIGCILYEMACGRPPFDSEVALEVLKAHLAARPPPPRALRPEIPESLQNVILTALGKRPDQRFQTAAAMRTALASAAGELAEDAFAEIGPISPRRQSMPPIMPGASGTRLRQQPPLPAPPPSSPPTVTAPTQPLRPPQPRPMLPSHPPRRVRWAVWGLVVLGVIATAAAALFWYDRAAPSTTPPAMIDAAPIKTTSSTVRVVIEAGNADAYEVWNHDGTTLLGRTATTIEVPADTTVTVILRASGFADKHVIVDGKTPQMKIALDPM